MRSPTESPSSDAQVSLPDELKAQSLENNQISNILKEEGSNEDLNQSQQNIHLKPQTPPNPTKNTFHKLHLQSIFGPSECSYFINSNAVIASKKVNCLPHSSRCASPEERLVNFGFSQWIEREQSQQSEPSIKKYTRRKSCKGGTIFGEVTKRVAEYEKIFPLTIINMHLKRIIMEHARKKKERERQAFKPIKRKMYGKEQTILKQLPQKGSSLTKSLFNSSQVAPSSASPSTPTNNQAVGSIASCSSTTPSGTNSKNEKMFLGIDTIENRGKSTSLNVDILFESNTNGENIQQSSNVKENNITSNSNQQVDKNNNSLEMIGAGSPTNIEEQMNGINKGGFGSVCSIPLDQEERKQEQEILEENKQINSTVAVVLSHIPLLQSQNSLNQQQEVTQENQQQSDGTVDECDSESICSPLFPFINKKRFQRYSQDISHMKNHRINSLNCPDLKLLNMNHRKSQPNSENGQNGRLVCNLQENKVRYSVFNVIAPPIRKNIPLLLNNQLPLSTMASIDSSKHQFLQGSPRSNQKIIKNVEPLDGSLCKKSISYLQKNQDIQAIVQEYLEPGSTEKEQYSPSNPELRVKSMKKVFVTATNMITLQNKVKANDSFYRNYYNLVGKISLDDNMQYLSQLADEVLSSPSNKQKDKILCAPKNRKVVIHTSMDDKVKVACSTNKLKLSKAVQQYVGDKQSSLESQSSFSSFSQSVNSSSKSKFYPINDYFSTSTEMQNQATSYNLKQLKKMIEQSKLKERKAKLTKNDNFSMTIGDQFLLHKKNQQHKRNISMQDQINQIKRDQLLNQTPILSDYQTNKKKRRLVKKNNVNHFSYSAIIKENLTPYLPSTSPILNFDIKPLMKGSFKQLNIYQEKYPQLPK